MASKTPPPNNTPVDQLQRRADGTFELRQAPIWLQWFSHVYDVIRQLIDYTDTSIQTPTEGFSITVGDRTKVLTLTPAGALAAGTITMPASPSDGQPLQVSATEPVAALTVSPNSGQTIKNAPTTIAAGSGFGYYYNAAATTWYRLY